MAFPTGPTNGQIYKNYKYNSTSGLWAKDSDIYQSITTSYSINCVADTEVKVCNLHNQAVFGEGLYSLLVSWGGDESHYWGGCFSAVIPFISLSVYNAAPTEPVSGTSTYHHRNGYAHIFTINSDEGIDTGYGYYSLFVKSYATYSDTFTVKLKKLS